MKQPPAGDSLIRGVAALRALIASGEQLRHAIAGHYVIGTSETVALSHLQLRGDLSPRELADQLGLTPSTVTSLLDRLETAGFVARSAHPTDRRKVVVGLTESGKLLIARSDEWLSAAMHRVGQDALPDVAASLFLLAAGLADQAAEIAALPHHGGL